MRTDQLAKIRRAQQAQVITVMREQNLRAGDAAKQCGFESNVVWLWMRKSPWFRKRVEEIHRELFYQIEEVGIHKALDGDSAMIRFFLQTMMKEKYGRKEEPVAIVQQETVIEEDEEVRLVDRDPASVRMEAERKLAERLGEIPGGKGLLERLQGMGHN